ncbi:MAG: methionyl-tRNA formyltransferase [Streptosporangiales bacterium]|nr:methionyl-tRNA formyltransferase [Streptosporangiales bacterium]
MRLVFAGTPAVAVPALDALLASGHDVVAVVTRPDRRAGRGRKVAASPVAERVRAADVELLQPERATDEAFVARLAELAPDCCPVVAYGALLQALVLAIPRHGWVNLHFSVLPAWRGAAPVQHALRAGDDVTGATVFQLVPEMDAGPVYGTVTESVRPRDTAGELLDRLASGGAELLVRVLDGIADGSVVAVPQPADGVSYAPKITSADAQVDWRQPAHAVDRQVRALTPVPGAWTTVHGQRLKLGPVEPADPDVDLAPGQLTVAKAGVFVGTATAPVRLGTVQPQGRPSMDAGAWARGARGVEGAVLGAPA